MRFVFPFLFGEPVNTKIISIPHTFISLNNLLDSCYTNIIKTYYRSDTIIHPTLLAFILLGIFILIGKFIRLNIPFLQKYFIPTALIAGFIGLFINQIITIPSEVTTVWREIPELFITIIFASLFIGKRIPNLKKIFTIARPQVSFGQTIAWGQYVIGGLITLLILIPFFNGNKLSAALIEISFQGGAGTALGLKDTFAQLGYPQGAEVGVGIATLGLLTGIISGIFLVNWGVRKNKTSVSSDPTMMSDDELKGVYKNPNNHSISLTTRSYSLETITIHLATILLAVGIGALFLKGFIWIENGTWGKYYDFYLFKYIPLFPLAMVGGVIIQNLISKFNLDYLINRKMIVHIQNLALDFLIVAAITNLSLSVIANNKATLIILFLAGFLWNLFAFIYIAPKIMSSYWFERGIVDYGQSMGMTTTGLLLLQIVDPDKKTPAFESFGYKQLFFEPIIGGGFFTALSLPLIANLGLTGLLIITSILFIFWLTFGIITNKANSSKT